MSVPAPPDVGLGAVADPASVLEEDDTAPLLPVIRIVDDAAQPASSSPRAIEPASLAVSIVILSKAILGAGELCRVGGWLGGARCPYHPLGLSPGPLRLQPSHARVTRRYFAQFML